MPSYSTLYNSETKLLKQNASISTFYRYTRLPAENFSDYLTSQNSDLLAIQPYLQTTTGSKLVKNNADIKFNTHTAMPSPTDSSISEYISGLTSLSGNFLHILSNNEEPITIFRALQYGNANNKIMSLKTIKLQKLPTTNNKYISLNHLIPYLYTDFACNIFLGLASSGSSVASLDQSSGVQITSDTCDYWIDGLRSESNYSNEPFWNLTPHNTIQPLHISYISIELEFYRDSSNAAVVDQICDAPIGSQYSYSYTYSFNLPGKGLCGVAIDFCESQNLNPIDKYSGTANVTIANNINTTMNHDYINVTDITKFSDYLMYDYRSSTYNEIGHGTNCWIMYLIGKRINYGLNTSAPGLRFGFSISGDNILKKDYPTTFDASMVLIYNNVQYPICINKIWLHIHGGPKYLQFFDGHYDNSSLSTGYNSMCDYPPLLLIPRNLKINRIDSSAKEVIINDNYHWTGSVNDYGTMNPQNGTSITISSDPAYNTLELKTLTMKPTLTPFIDDLRNDIIRPIYY